MNIGEFFGALFQGDWDWINEDIGRRNGITDMQIQLCQDYGFVLRVSFLLFLFEDLEKFLITEPQCPFSTRIAVRSAPESLSGMGRIIHIFLSVTKMTTGRL